MEKLLGMPLPLMRGKEAETPPSAEIAWPHIAAIVFFSYLVTGYIGLQLQSVNTFSTLIWPPSGIAFAAFLMYGRRVWPWVYAAALLLNFLIGAPIIIALCIALGNTAGPFAGAYLVKRYGHYNPNSLRVRHIVAILVTAFIVASITSTVGTLSLWAGDLIASSAFWATWTTWWIGDVLGTLICALFILIWFHKPFFKRTISQYLELVAAEIAVAAFSFMIFWSPPNPYSYTLFIPLTWVALRTGLRGISTALPITSAIAIAGTLLGQGPFASFGLAYLQVYLATMGMVFLIFTAIVQERKEVMKTLKLHVEELEGALHKISAEDEAKKEFLAILAHELRNPLATILSSIELIRLQGFSAANTNMLLETIDDRSRAMVHLLDDLLDISRISQKKLAIEKEIVAVDAFMDKLIFATQPLVEKYGHNFNIERPSQELYIHGDPVRLEQIFMNLTINASKYTKSPGKIDISVRQEKDMVTTSIKDTGVGIPESMLRRIFEPFFQINRGRSGNEGMGIGLPLTRQLVEMHGGTIEAKSEGSNQGSEFIVRLPLYKYTERKPQLPEYPSKLTSQAVRKPRQVKRTFKILLIDDNQETSSALAKMLKLRGHATALAMTGNKGVQKALSFKPDVILLDIGLPDIDGYQVAQKLRSQKKPYMIVALTGYGQPEDKERAKEAGFDHHLTKPAGLKEIEAVLKKAPAEFGRTAD